MNGRYTKAEREHVGRVKELPCSVCDAPGPSDADHWFQGLHFLVIAVCPDCHRGDNGRRNMNRWRIFKMTPEKALNKTLARLKS